MQHITWISQTLTEVRGKVEVQTVSELESIISSVCSDNMPVFVIKVKVKVNVDLYSALS